MTLTKVSTGGVKDDAVTAGKIPANAVGSSEIADDAVDQGAIADEAVDEARLQISNAGSNGQFLSKQSGNTGGLTWATPPDTNTQVGGNTGVDFNNAVKIRLGSDADTSIYHDSFNNTFYEHENASGNVYFRNDGSNTYFQMGTGNEASLTLNKDGPVIASYDGSAKFQTTTAGISVTGTVSDSKGDLRLIPLNNITSAYTAVAADSGKTIYTNSGVTINQNVFATGDAVTIVNSTDSDITITQGTSLNLYNSADGSTGNKTLGARGMATIYFAATNYAYMSGAGLS